jgi:hypothetical protein
MQELTRSIQERKKIGEPAGKDEKETKQVQTQIHKKHARKRKTEKKTKRGARQNEVA